MGRANDARGGDADPAFDEFLELWRRLWRANRDDAAVILVEGERDRRSLTRLGLEGEIALVHRGKSLAETAQTLVQRHRAVILLTDWDREGGNLARRLRALLQSGGSRSISSTGAVSPASFAERWSTWRDSTDGPSAWPNAGAPRSRRRWSVCRPTAPKG